MKRKRGDRKKMKAQGTAAARASTSPPAHVYGKPESLAKEKKVSLAWAVREAAEKYIGGLKEGAV